MSFGNKNSKRITRLERQVYELIEEVERLSSRDVRPRKKTSGSAKSGDIKYFHVGHKRVLNVFAAHPEGLTPNEATSKAGYKNQGNASAVSELKNAGYLTATGERRGRSRVLVISDKGRDYINSDDKVGAA